MQEKIQIISDGSLDLSREITDKRDIRVVPFYVSFDGETYRKEGEELDIREFYQQMVEHPDVFPKTSMPSVDDYYQVFLPLAKEGTPMICICITTKFSGSMQSANTARDMVLEEYPDARITVIDATVNTVLQGLYVLEACRLRDMGWEYDRIVERILAIRESGRIFFTIGSIDYLKHGGRIGKLTGLAAGALKIKPLITLKEGEIFNSGVTRNRHKSMEKVVQMLKAYLDERNAKLGEYSFAIGFGYDYGEACQFREMLKDLVRERLGINEIKIYQIGATIGVHTGPYPIGVGIIRRADWEG
ncbi:MAG: DegV family protein [Roseburia sp.]|nr:DegV family protein [Roseburia sp.]